MSAMITQGNGQLGAGKRLMLDSEANRRSLIGAS